MSAKRLLITLPLMVLLMVLCTAQVSFAQPPPPPPENVYGLFGLPIDNGSEILAIVLVGYGLLAIVFSKYKLSLAKILRLK